MIMKIKLNFFDKESIEFSIDSKTVIIGKSDDCDIVLSVDGFSRKHCQVDVENDDIYITDLNSTNGVEINDERIEAGKKTLYHSFLNLRIGPTKSVEIEL